MKQILFRGKRKDNEAWIEGDLIHIDIGCVIVYNRVLSIDDSLPKGIDLSFSNDEFAVVDPPPFANTQD